MLKAREFENRRERLRVELRNRKLNAVVVSASPNVRYLSGFTGSNGVLVMSAEHAVLFTDPRYELQAARETACKTRIARGPLWPEVAGFVKRNRFRRLGFENTRLNYDSWEMLREVLPLGAALHPAGGVVEALRMVKSAAEVALIRQSVLTNSAAYSRVMKKVRPGWKEYEIAAEIECQMRRLGADKPAFESIVAAGRRSALVHARPTSNPLARNQLLLIDIGAIEAGYSSDMTRMAYLGAPSPKVKRLYQAVWNAQRAAIAAIRPGVHAGEIDRVARRVLKAEKLDRWFVHSTGHGLGLEIHEPPRLGKRDQTRLEPGMAITVEPGVYLEGFGGVRIEDTVVVTATGCEILTPTSKDLLLV